MRKRAHSIPKQGLTGNDPRIADERLEASSKTFSTPSSFSSPLLHLPSLQHRVPCASPIPSSVFRCLRSRGRQSDRRTCRNSFREQGKRKMSSSASCFSHLRHPCPCVTASFARGNLFDQKFKHAKKHRTNLCALWDVCVQRKQGGECEGKSISPSVRESTGTGFFRRAVSVYPSMPRDKEKQRNH